MGILEPELRMVSLVVVYGISGRKRPGAAQHSEHARQLIPNTTARDTTPSGASLANSCRLRRSGAASGSSTR